MDNYIIDMYELYNIMLKYSDGICWVRYYVKTKFPNNSYQPSII